MCHSALARSITWTLGAFCALLGRLRGFELNAPPCTQHFGGLVQEARSSDREDLYQGAAGEVRGAFDARALLACATRGRWTYGSGCTAVVRGDGLEL